VLRRHASPVAVFGIFPILDIRLIMEVDSTEDLYSYSAQAPALGTNS
jgi:hypothetical protein